MRENTIDKKIMFYGSSALLLTLIAMVIRTLCFFFAFDSEIGYYKEGFLPSLLTGFCVLSALLFISAFVKIKKDTISGTGRENNLLLKCASGVVVALSLYSLIAYSGEILYANKGIVALLGIVGALMSVAYFAYNYLSGDNSQRATQAVFGFGVIIVAVIVVFVSYFDVYSLMNSPIKVNLHIALLSLMLFVLNEIRAFAGEINKGFYVFSLTTATFFSGVSSIPTIVYCFSKSENIKYLPHNVVLAGVFFYLVARLAAFMLASVEGESESDV